LGQSFVGLEELAERLLELPVDDHVDDVAVLAVSRDAPTSDEIKFRSEVVAEPEALAEMRGRFYAWLGEEGIPHSVAADAVLAASEAVANAVEHAYLNTDGIVVVSASIVEDELRVRVDDTGSWRPFPHDGSAGRGRGFAIMEGLMDDIDVHSSTTGTHVQLSRRLEGLDS
jgi:anti-sigma regulatory factor (Ser/Thr protein kinase)